METLPSSSGGRTPFMEKLIRYGVPAAIGVAIFWFWGTIAPFVVDTLHNTLKAVIYGIITGAIVLPLILYPTFWWMQYKNIVHWFMSLLINMDPLAFMDRYVDILREKLANVNKTRVLLKGKKVASERRITQLNKDITAALKQGEAALKLNDKKTASLAGSRASSMKQSVVLYTPNYEKLTKSCAFLDELAENWDMSITKLSEEVARKREEYEVLRDEAKALNQAEEFIKGDTEAGRIYQESVKALESTVTGYIAQIDDFEARSKDLLAGIKVDNQMQHDEGLSMLESYMNNGSLLLPTDYTAPAPKFRNTSMVQDVPYEDVKKDSFKLLD